MNFLIYFLKDGIFIGLFWLMVVYKLIFLFMEGKSYGKMFNFLFDIGCVIFL